MTAGSIDFNNLQCFVNFIGWARTGHSIIGALLDAHPNIIISNEEFVLKKFNNGLYNTREQLFNRIIRVSEINKRDHRPASEEYFQEIEDGYQGEIKDNKLRIIGDKKGGGTSIMFRRDRQIIDKFQEFVQLPIKNIIVLRNPMDTIGTALTKRPTTFDRRLKSYNSVFNLLDQFLKKDYQTHIMKFEDLILNFDKTWCKLLNFLEITYDKHYLESCKEIVFAEVPKSRYKIEWDQNKINKIKDLCSKHWFLKDYLDDLEV